MGALTPLEQAKQWLGERWVLHPNYRHDPRHSVWAAPIRRAAAAAPSNVVSMTQRNQTVTG